MSYSPHLKIGVIVQARMGATRLPGKPLLKVKDKTLLEHIISRLKQIKHPLTVIIATTQNEQDKSILALAKKLNIPTYAGSEEDVLDRYIKTARHYDLDVIIRVTADCPLLDPELIDEALNRFLDPYPEIDYFSNTIERTYPRGMDFEVFKRRTLEEAYLDAVFEEEREHVTPFIYRHPERFKIAQLRNQTDESQHRWTVDTKEDFELIKRLIEAFQDDSYRLHDLIEVIKKNPDWSLLNQYVQQKTF